jgi:hypothetical protein
MSFLSFGHKDCNIVTNFVARSSGNEGDLRAYLLRKTGQFPVRGKNCEQFKTISRAK